MKKHLFTIFLLTILFIPAISSAAPNFLTLPFENDLTVTQGWRYNPDNCVNPGPDPCKHESIDYSTGYDLKILAAANGVARKHSQYNNGYGYGEYVFISHPNSYFTLYAHLSTTESWIPYTNSQDTGIWAPVGRGQGIGRSGASGAGNSASHLHYEARLDNYTANPERKDPYDINTTSNYYPPAGSSFVGCGSNYLWTQCPPVPPNTNPTLPIVNVSGNITQDTTWQAGNVYLISGGITVEQGVTLTLESGVIVKFFNTSSSLVNNGFISAIGTSQDKIYFTSYKDDTVGGDSNSDNNATTPAPEDWKNVSTQLGGVTHITNGVVKYGGKFNCGSLCTGALANSDGVLKLTDSLLSQNLNGIVTLGNGYTNITRSTITKSLYNGINASGDIVNLRISNSTISDNGESGVNLPYSNGITNINLSITDSVLSKNGNLGSGLNKYGFSIIRYQGILNLTVTNTDFVDNIIGDGYISFGNYSDLNFINYENTTSGTGGNGFDIYGAQIKNDQIWNLGVPFIVRKIKILANDSLTINPGTIVKFVDTNSNIDVYGILNTIGTSQNKIYFTSYKDDTVGGDSNGDGSATIPAPEDWRNIIVNTGSTVDISNSVIRYGGYFHCQIYWGCSGWPGGIKVGGGDLNVSDSLIEKNNHGIYFVNATSTASISNTTINDNGNLGIDISGPNSNLNLLVSNSTISNHSEHGMYTIPSGCCPTINLSLIGNTFLNNQIYDAYIPILSSFINQGNTTSGTGGNGFHIGGNINGNQTWNPGVPYIVSSVIVPAGTILTINPGTVIKFQYSPYLGVYGTLNALGAPQNRIHFTSFKDDTVGGDTNGDGSTTTPAPKDWSNIIVYGGGLANISNASISYGGYTCSFCGILPGVLSAYGGEINISNSEITKSNYGIYRSAGTVNVTKSSIKDNTSYGIYHTGTGTTTQAINNWWGHISGPFNSIQNPSGQGDQVSSNVIYSPWLLKEPLYYKPSIPTP